MIAPLKNATYRHLFSAQIIALLGTGMTTVALALLAFELAGDRAGTVLGTALALKMTAYVIAAPVFNGLASSLPRKTVLVTLDIIRALFVISLPFVSEVWQIYIIIFLMQLCSAGFTPMFQATILDILPDEKEYTQALSLSRLAYDLESLISPTLAAVALIFVSFDTLFALNAVAFLISGALVVTAILPKSEKGKKEEPDSTWHKISFGIRAYLATPRLRGLLALSFAVSSAGALVIVNTVVLVQVQFGMGERAVALALAAFGFGAMVAALVLPRLLEHIADRPVMLTGSILMATTLASGILINSYPALLTLWFLIGLGYSATQTPSGLLLRRSSKPEHRPAFFAAHFALSHGCWLISYPLAGWLVPAIGLYSTFVVFAVLAAIGTSVATLLWPSVDKEKMVHSHDGLNEDDPHWEEGSHRSGNKHIHTFQIDHLHQRWPSNG